MVLGHDGVRIYDVIRLGLLSDTWPATHQDNPQRLVFKDCGIK